MSAIHRATSSPLVKELVAAAVQRIRSMETYAVSQGAGLHPSDPASAAATAVYELWTDLDDNLQIDIAVVLAAWGIGAGEVAS